MTPLCFGCLPKWIEAAAAKYLSLLVEPTSLDHPDIENCSACGEIAYVTVSVHRSKEGEKGVHECWR